MAATVLRRCWGVDLNVHSKATLADAFKLALVKTGRGVTALKSREASSTTAAA